MAPGAGENSLSRLRCQGAEPAANGEGTGFCVWSSCAERVELCLFDKAGRETGRADLQRGDDGDWSLYCKGVGPGQHYGYRVHGPWAPDQGLRCNPAKLLLDPYARQIRGEFRWAPAVLDYDPDGPEGYWQASTLDSAPFVPKSVVCAEPAPVQRDAIRRWSDSVIYETNVRGYTMRHPGVPASERGRFSGLCNGDIIAYLKALGITTIELQPVHSWIDEHHLARLGLSNYWGYNSIGFFAPEQRLAGPAPVTEFRAMVAALHDAGLEVLLDVVYNHTGEGDALGPTLCFRGLDNLAYYRVEPDDPAVHVNDTGTGNTLNADHPRAQALVLDSLIYWYQRMGVDGFRFDLAPILGRHANGFDPSHPLLKAIESAPELAGARLIAEPWDTGPGGYQLGSFPDNWSEWNDRYRDVVRQFWRGDQPLFEEFARRVDGSPDLFLPPGRNAANSINFVTAHDGFTLTDLVSYRHRHNEANGEQNRDGHAHNYAHNHGVEGPTDSRVVQALRRRHRLNLLGTVLLSQGVPMLLAGDELGHSQQGNNNAYAQDNDLGWLDWSILGQDEAFLESVRQLIAIRAAHGLLRGIIDSDTSHPPVIEWLTPQGEALTKTAWAHRQAALQVLSGRGEGQGVKRVAVYINGLDHEITFHLPTPGAPVGQRPEGTAPAPEWVLAWSSAPDQEGPAEQGVRVAAWSIGVFLSDRPA